MKNKNIIIVSFAVYAIIAFLFYIITNHFLFSLIIPICILEVFCGLFGLNVETYEGRLPSNYDDVWIIVLEEAAYNKEIKLVDVIAIPIKSIFVIEYLLIFGLNQLKQLFIKK